MGDEVQRAAGPGDGAPYARAGTRCGEREHEEQIADLRRRRIGDQQLQPRLAQREHAAQHYRPGA